MNELKTISKTYYRLSPLIKAVAEAKQGLATAPEHCHEDVREYAEIIRTCTTKIINILRDNNLPLESTIHMSSELEFAVWVAAQQE